MTRIRSPRDNSQSTRNKSKIRASGITPCFNSSAQQKKSQVKIQHGIPMRTTRRIPNLTIAKQAFLQEVAMVFLVPALSDACVYRGITCFSKHFDVSYRSLNKLNSKQINCENEGKLKL